MQVVINIPRAPTLHRDGEKPFIVYELDVQVKSGQDTVFQSKVLRRYSDFRKLAKSLSRNNLPAIDIPGKLLFNTAGALEARKVALQESLNEYCAKMIAKMNRLDYPVSTFLGVQDYFRIPSALNVSTSSKDIILNPDMSLDSSRISPAVVASEANQSFQYPHNGEVSEAVAVNSFTVDAPVLAGANVLSPIASSSDDKDPNTESNGMKKRSSDSSTDSFNGDEGEQEIDTSEMEKLVKDVKNKSEARNREIHQFALLLLVIGFITVKFPSSKSSLLRLAVSWFTLGAGTATLILSKRFASIISTLPNDIPMKKKENKITRSIESTVQPTTKTHAAIQSSSSSNSTQLLNNEQQNEAEEEDDDLTQQEPAQTATAPVSTTSTNEQASDGALEEIEKIDTNYNESRHSEAMKIAHAGLTKVGKEHPQYREFLWRYARCIYYVTQSMRNDEKLKLIQSALKLLEESPKPYTSEIHKYLALLKNMQGELGGTKEKIVNAYEYEKHTKEAIALNPEDPTLHFMLGRFCFGVAQLSWFERKAAATVFGKEPPKSTYDEAMDHFKSCISKRPNEVPMVIDLLWVAKCHKEIGNKKEAINALRKALSKDPSQDGPLDADARKEAATLLEELL